MRLDKKELIRQAAVRVISSQGFHGSTTDKIAAEAGVSVGTIYNYFHNKEDILGYIFQVELEKRAGFFDQLEKRNLSASEKLRSFLQMHFAEVKKNVKIGLIIVRERALPDRQLAPARDFSRGISSLIQKIVEEGIASGEFRNCDAEMIAAAMFGATEAVVRRCIYWYETNERAENDPLDSAAQELFEFFVAGLSS